MGRCDSLVWDLFSEKSVRGCRIESLLNVFVAKNSEDFLRFDLLPRRVREEVDQAPFPRVHEVFKEYIQTSNIVYRQSFCFLPVTITILK